MDATVKAESREKTIQNSSANALSAHRLVKAKPLQYCLQSIQSAPVSTAQNPQVLLA